MPDSAYEALVSIIAAALTAARARADEAEKALADERRHHARTRADLGEVQDGECCDGYEGQIALLQAVIRDQTIRADEAEAGRVEAVARAEKMWRAVKPLREVAEVIERLYPGYPDYVVVVG